MIIYDPKNWIRILLDFPRSPVFRTLFLDVIAAGSLLRVRGVARDRRHVRSPCRSARAFLSILGHHSRPAARVPHQHVVRPLVGGKAALGAAGERLARDSRTARRHASRPTRRSREQYADLLASFPSTVAGDTCASRAGRPARTPQRPSSGSRDALHRDVAVGRLPRECIIALHPLLSAFDDITGACERIRNTPIPFSYSSYIKQFVLLYALSCPSASCASSATGR
jgi:ion channel-forming bestrophin family protein